MKIIRSCKIKTITREQREQLLDLILRFESAKRYTLNLLTEGHYDKELIKKLQYVYSLNKRYCEDAVLQAQTIIFSQKDPLPVYLENNQKKLEQTIQKIKEYKSGRRKPKKVPLDVCLNCLRKRKQKLKQKIAMYKTHIANGTLPSVIFRGQKAFYECMKQNIPNQEWKYSPKWQLYSRGDKSKKGNLNIRIIIDNNSQGWLEIANPLGLTPGKGTSTRIVVPITIPYRYYKEITDVVMGTQTGTNSKEKPMIDHQAYSVELLRKKDEFYVNITFEKTKKAHI